MFSREKEKQIEKLKEQLQATQAQLSLAGQEIEELKKKQIKDVLPNSPESTKVVEGIKRELVDDKIPLENKKKKTKLAKRVVWSSEVLTQAMYDDQLQQKNADLSRQKEEIEALKVHVTLMESDIQKQEGEYKTLKALHEDKKQKLDIAQTKLAPYEKKEQDLIRKLEEMKAQATNQQDRFDHLQKEVDNHKEENKKLAQGNQELDAIRVQVETQRALLNDQSNRILSQGNTIAEKEKIIAGHAQETTSLKEKHEKEIEKIKLELEAQKKLTQSREEALNSLQIKADHSAKQNNQIKNGLSAGGMLLGISMIVGGALLAPAGIGTALIVAGTFVLLASSIKPGEGLVKCVEAKLSNLAETFYSFLTNKSTNSNLHSMESVKEC